MVIERNQCPEEFAQRLAEIGGLNRFNEPNFKLYWGQTETYRAGGEWAGNGQVTFCGYRDLLVGMNDPGWLLMQWQPPEKYGTPESYYFANYDEGTGLQILGEYPYSGRYETVIPLIHRQVKDGRLIVEHMPLSSLLLDLIVPIIRNCEQISYTRCKALMDERKEAAEREQVSQIESSLANAFPAFGSASRSGSYLACNSVVQKKAESIERYWRGAVHMLKSRGKGLSVGPTQ